MVHQTPLGLHLLARILLFQWNSTIGTSNTAGAISTGSNTAGSTGGSSAIGASTSAKTTSAGSNSAGSTQSSGAGNTASGSNDGPMAGLPSVAPFFQVQLQGVPQSQALKAARVAQV